MDSSEGKYYMTIAQIYRKSNKLPLTLKFAKKAESLGLKSEELFLCLAEISLIRKNYQQGINECNKVLKINQENAQAYFFKGIIYEESKDYDRAASSFQTAIEQDNMFTDAYANLINLKTRQRDYIFASQYVESALRFIPNDKFIWYNYGVLLQTQELNDSALNAFNKTLELDSMFVFASYNKGLILLRNDEKDQASKIFMRILKYDPLFELAYLRMGEELILAKDYVAANDILRKGLINLPESKEIQTLYNSTKSKI